MAIPTRAAGSTFGPRGGATTWWTAASGSYRATGIDSATTVYDVYMAPPVSTNTTTGGVTEALPGGNVVQTVGGIWIYTNATVALHLAGLSINFDLYRAGSQLGSAHIAGWGASTGATPLLTAHVPVLVPWVNTNTTALVAPPNFTLSSANALCPLQPNDVIVMTVVSPSSWVGNDVHVALDIN